MAFTGFPTKGTQSLQQSIANDGWRVVPGFDDYQISESGRIRRATFTANRKGKPGDEIQSKVGNSGYLRVGLWRDGRMSAFSVHRLVALAFIGTPPTLSHEVSHIDGTRSNNHFTNLRWETRTQNHAHKERHGTAQVGSRNGNGKLTEAQVKEIKQRLPCNMAALAREFKVSHPTISQISRGEIWKHVDLKELV